MTESFAMQLGMEPYETYWARGWVAVEGIYQPEEVDRIAELAISIGQRQIDEGTQYTVDVSPDGAQKAPRKIDNVFTVDERFQPFVLDQRLRSVVEKLIGQRPLLFKDQLFMKPPRFGTAKPYHQDNAYFRMNPADHVITAWIALDDVDESNGCLRYIDGSHLGPILPHVMVPGEPHNQAPPAELIDLSKQSLAVVGKGGVVFHHSKMLHTSGRNKSNQWRRGYATHWVTADVTDETGRLAEAYFLKSEYAAMLR